MLGAVVAAIAMTSPVATCPPAAGNLELLSTATAQVHRTVPAYLFCAYGLDVDGGIEVLSIRVLDSTDGAQLQALTSVAPEPLASHYRLRPEPTMKDLNFDGYADLTLLAQVGGTGNTTSRVWIFDPATRRFEYHRELSEQGQLEAHPDRKELTAHWHGGHAGAIFNNRTFRWIKGELTLVREEDQDWQLDRKCYEHVIRELRSGQLAETVKECRERPADPSGAER